MGIKFKQLVVYLMIASSIGCSNYYFDTPQPVDEKSVYEFPKKMRGMWGEKEEDGGVIIGPNFFTIEEIQTDTFSAISFDKQFVTVNNKAFKIPKDTVNGSFSVGKAYTERLGQIVVSENPEDKKIHLGPSNFLRKCGDGYLLNLEEPNGWYTLVYLNSLSKRRLEVSIVTLPDSVIEAMTVANHFVGKIRDDYYFSVDWNSDEWKSKLTEGDMIVAFDTLTRISKNIE